MKKINYCLQQKTETEHEIYLYDDVTKIGKFNWETYEYDESETSAKHFAEMLNSIPDTANIHMYFNCNGGSVDQGTAIFNMLCRHKAHKTGYVDGVCNSIAFTIFQAMDHRIMGEGTTATIHEMWGYFEGNANDLREYADQLDVRMESCIALFLERAKGVEEQELRDMFKQTTVLTPQMAVTYGFCDEVSSKSNDASDKSLVASLQSENLELKQRIQNDAFQKKDFAEFAQRFETKKPEKPEHRASALDAFFNA